MVQDLPVGVMFCDINDDFRITYANKFTVETLRSIEHLLPCRASEIVGQSVDIFHKNPSHQRQLLSDPRNLPHHAMIELGGEYLDLNVSALYNSKGSYIGPVLSWSLATARVVKEKEADQLIRMVDEMPINVMLADPNTRELTFVNKTSIETLRPLQSLLPVPVDQLKGQCIDIFHKNPSHQAAILADPTRLPWNSKISLGDETLALRVSAIYDKDGSYVTPLLTWDVVTDQVKMADEFEDNVASVVCQRVLCCRRNAVKLERHGQCSRGNPQSILFRCSSFGRAVQHRVRNCTPSQQIFRDRSERCHRSATI